MGPRHGGYPDPLPTAPGGKGLLPPPQPGETTACRPMWTRWMALCLSIRALTTTALATRPPSPVPRAKISRKRLEKEKTPQGRLFYIFMLEGQRALTAYSHSMVAGGLPETSYTTREMPLISLMMRFDTWPRKSYGR